MKPLERFPARARRAVRGVLTDIDDTLTTEGSLTAESYGALERLQRAGLLVVPITGRPAGWCDHMARMWPIDAVVGENGGFYFRYDHGLRRMTKRFLADEAERAANRQRLETLRDDVLRDVPGAAIASDQPYRETDIAIDYSEDVAPLPLAEAKRIVTLLSKGGARAMISSIHVNGWIGTYDKLSTARIMLDECFGIDLDADRDAFVFVGDSPNDAPMFAFFPNAVGVANVATFSDRLETPPTYITRRTSGAGFVELAESLLAVRE